MKISTGLICLLLAGLVLGAVLFPALNRNFKSARSPENTRAGGSSAGSVHSYGGDTAPSESVAQNAPLVTAKPQQASLTNADKAQTPIVPTDRKIIRNGELTIELDDPAAAQRGITTIAESLGGFVVTSESQQAARDGQQKGLSVTIIVRVPSTQFAAAVDKIRSIGAGARVLNEKLTGQDVTEEFIDVEARIKTKKALEAQFMEIMKRAQKISDALEVQTQLAEVRGEIEQLEGRRRFLENQSALSTITIHLQTPAPLVATAPNGFWRSVREAFGDGLTAATEIILGIIRLAFILLPIVLLIVLPAWALWRFALRRFFKFKKPESVIPQS